MLKPNLPHGNLAIFICFPGKKLLSVDMNLISTSNMIHSRDPRVIIDYILKSEKQNIGTSRAKKVKDEVLELVNSCVVND